MIKKVWMTLLTAVMIAALLPGCQKKNAQQTEAPATSSVPASSSVHLTAADFERIEFGMSMTEVVEILGHRGKYVDGWSDMYEYVASDGTSLHIWYEKVDEAIAKIDENMVVVGIRVIQQE